MSFSIPLVAMFFDESMRCLNWGARFVVVGFASGRAAQARTNHVLIKGASIVGIRAGEFARRNPQQGEHNLQTLLTWAEEGRIRPHVSHQFKLPQYQSAMETLIRREVIGRVAMTKSVEGSE